MTQADIVTIGNKDFRRPGDPDDDVVECLELALAEARSGALRAVSVSGVYSNGDGLYGNVAKAE